MASKGVLGTSYLVSVGIVLFGSLTGVLVPPGTGLATTESTSLLGLCLGVMVAGCFTLTGVGLSHSGLDGERVWRVAAWSTLGLGVPTLLSVFLLLWVPATLGGVGWRSVVMVDITAGGVVGVLVGALLNSGQNTNAHGRSTSATPSFSACSGTTSEPASTSSAVISLSSMPTRCRCPRPPT
ncbi:MAG: hypothetical protein ABEJ73_06405 [Haloplanus sp.]